MILNRIYYLIPLGHTQLHTRLLPRRHSFSIHRFPQQQGLSSKGDRPGAHNSGAWNTRIFALLSWLYYSRLVSIEAQNYHHCHRANTVSAGALSSNMITQATHKKQVGSSSDATSEQSRNKRVHQSTHQQCSFTRLAVIHCTSRWTENRSIWISEWTSLKSYEYTVTYNNGLPDLSTGA